MNSFGRAALDSNNSEPDIALNQVLSIVLAGGAGKRLQPLTLKHAKPALPLVRHRRIIDFVLSNLWHSGFHRLMLLTQYKPDSLQQHLYKLWQPRFAQKGSFSLYQAPEQACQGTAGAVMSQLSHIRDQCPQVVAILSADHVYKMDYRQMLAFHLQQHSALTVSAVSVPVALAHHFGIFAVDSDFRVCGFSEKPQSNVAEIPGRPGFALASMGNYLFNAASLYQALVNRDPANSCDFGHDILPTLFARQQASVYDFNQNQLPGSQSLPHYWRDVGTLAAYYHSKLDVLQHPDWLDGPEQPWPILASSHSTLLGPANLTPVQRLPLQNHHPLYC
ncbi:sugar phosphate nucleotidyltransferase [Rheinheimera maricola]|uniref:NTP transferase domain-containing protein n=1 Tax=Rheinheimera maricola TaxID=2793282 RepID=A0ABS7X4J4_9GAMM|nr:sugar phosphate nucleotidyltransferase [Rheinheimera maricola]MBZ9610462.1 NTP transferase domain-containing protein [Rheinheimera maricola]